jgi:vanadium chloroperoxidase
MYDAYAGAVNTPASLPLYLSTLTPPAAGASPAAAVAAAARATLSALFPSQKAFFELRHQQAGLLEPGLKEGHAFGLLVATALLEDRKNDPGAGDNGYASSMQPGRHRPDPDNPHQGFHGPFFGRARCFAVKKRLGLLPPPQPGDAGYKKALDEVRGKGIAPELIGTVPAALPKRSSNEALVGLFWAYDGALDLGTPPRLYNQIIRQVAIARGNSEQKNAQLFALVNAAMGDAAILAWEQKYIHDLWRPVVGIREHDPSMGPAGAGGGNISDDTDTGWLPFGAPSTNAASERFLQSQEHYPCQSVRTGII